MATVVMAIEGVLTETMPPNANLMHYESSDQGKVLYLIFRDTTRLVLFSADSDRDRVKAWLARERFGHYADVHCYPQDSLLEPSMWRVQHTKDLIGIGHHIAFYIDSDPNSVAMALEAGIGSILVARPGNTPGNRGDDMAFISWVDLVDTIEQQNMLRAAKTVEADNG